MDKSVSRGLARFGILFYPARARSAQARGAGAQARGGGALRALGLLLYSRILQWEGGRLFDRSAGFFTETAVTREQKVEKSLLRWEINRHAEG